MDIKPVYGMHEYTKYGDMVIRCGEDGKEKYIVYFFPDGKVKIGTEICMNVETDEIPDTLKGVILALANGIDHYLESNIRHIDAYLRSQSPIPLDVQEMMSYQLEVKRALLKDSKRIDLNNIEINIPDCGNVVYGKRLKKKSFDLIGKREGDYIIYKEPGFLGGRDKIESRYSPKKDEC